MKQISYNDKNKYAFRFSTDVLQLRTYGVDGRHLSYQRLNTLQHVVDMKATCSQKKAEPSMMNRIYLVIRRLFLRE